MHQTISVLIVEDELPSAKLLQQLLEKDFPFVKIARHASGVAEAYEFLKANTVDLVFLDIELKGNSGFDLLDKIKDRNFQFIALSATTEASFKTFEYGGSGYLLKPVNQRELSTVIEHILRRKPVIQ